MGGKPLVSVIIPTWNRRELVLQAIASIVGQSYENWELIVVDDGSTDGTVQQLAKLDEPRLRVIAAGRVGNGAIARNLGIAQANGDWIAFLDSDDLWVPEKLELQMAALARSGAAWCYGDHSLMSEDGADIPMRAGGFRALNGRVIESLLLGRTGICVDCLLVRRDIFEMIGDFDSSGRFFPDLDLTFRLASVADAVAVDQVLARVREHPQRETRDTSFPHEKAARVYRNFLLRKPERYLARLARKRIASHLADAAADRVGAGHLSRGARLLGESLFLRDSPRHWIRASARAARRLVGR